MAELPANVIVPCQTKSTRIPLYSAIGLTENQSNRVYFEVKENMVPKCGTVAELLREIIDSQKLTPTEKVWAAYNADKLALEVAKGNGVVELFRRVIGK